MHLGNVRRHLEGPTSLHLPRGQLSTSDPSSYPSSVEERGPLSFVLTSTVDTSHRCGSQPILLTVEARSACKKKVTAVLPAEHRLMRNSDPSDLLSATRLCLLFAPPQRRRSFLDTIQGTLPTCLCFFASTSHAGLACAKAIIHTPPLFRNLFSTTEQD